MHGKTEPTSRNARWSILSYTRLRVAGVIKGSYADASKWAKELSSKTNEDYGFYRVFTLAEGHAVVEKPESTDTTNQG